MLPGMTPIAVPINVASMPWWPGAKRAVELVVSGAKEEPQVACEYKFSDKSTMTLEYQTGRRVDVPDGIYERCGSPPLLSIVVDDHYAGVRVDPNGINRRVAANKAENALAELTQYIGADKPMAIVGEIIKKSRRAYWVRLEA